jgi:polysaccharide biosynthesis protein PslH
MRLLVASLESPTPVVNGASLRLFHLLEELRRRHDIHVVCYGRTVDLEGVAGTVLEPPPPASLTTRLLRGARSLVSSPALAQETRSGPLNAAAAELGRSGRFDVAHLSGAATAVLSESLTDLPSLWDTIDAWHLSRAEEARADPFPRSVLRRAGSLSIRRFEREALKRANVTTATSAADRAALLDVSPSARVEVVSNGVDTEYFAPQATRDGAQPVIAFHGNFAYSPNADAARFLALDVLPRVANEVPDATLRLIGRNPPDNVQALAGPRVEITGEVADVRPVLAAATVVACAMRTGTGIKNKLLEAAALGLPIVATPGAVGDLGLRDGEELLVRDGPEAIAGAIVELLGSPTRCEQLGSAARAAVVERWTWPRAASSFEALYDAISRA